MYVAFWRFLPFTVVFLKKLTSAVILILDLNNLLDRLESLCKKLF